MNSSGYIIALSGPSGIGKGFIKETIRNRYPGIIDLTVVTTRPRRSSDGVDRETDVPINEFLHQRNVGDIILAHQPFGIEHDWYGFRKSQIDDGLHAGNCMLTEIHPDNISLFNSIYPSSIFIFGFVAPENYIRHNLEFRNTENAREKELRVHQSISEIEQILQSQQKGLIQRLFDFSSPDLRDTVASEILDNIHLLRGGIELPRIQKER